ncbi:MAG TPA: macro domain-containing protein [Armatimonadota bacterium]|nr:macro domain-containing protein [Armatimonadota bacterium]
MERRIILCDLYQPVIDAWERAFAGCPDVEVRRGDLTELPADAYVSAANSFGEMGGGVDWALRERFGYEIEDRVMETIAQLHGRLPVGLALIVETGDGEVPYLIVAPTMEVPSNVAHTQNAYAAMCAVLLQWRDFEREHPDEILTIVVPGLCTGTGMMNPHTAAGQMRRAYDEFQADGGVDGAV